MLKTFFFFLLFVGIKSAFAQVEPALELLSRYHNVRDWTMSANQDEAYFTIQSPLDEIAVIVVIKKEKNKWIEPALVSFTGKYRDIEPFLTIDGLRLYFASNRPLNDTSTLVENYDIWYVERKDSKSPWSSPINVGAPINTTNNEFYPSLSKNNNLYFTSDANEANKDDIYLGKWNGKNYDIPTALDNNINSVGYEFNAYIAADESYLIYTAYNRKDGFGSGDLYCSNKDKDGNWMPAANLGAAVNSTKMDYCPFVNSKTNTLYFTSKRTAISPSNFKTLKDFEQTINQYENGFSRIYQVPVSTFLNKN